MTPIYFPESNTIFGPPSDLEESQCMKIHAHVGQVRSGSVDGALQVVVAWQPDASDIAKIIAGNPIFLSCIGGLPPHFLTTDFHSATHPA